MSDELARAIEIAQAVRNTGGRALIVGGWVRDRLMNRPSKDIDVEVYRLPASELRGNPRTIVRTRGNRRRELSGIQGRRHRRVAPAPRVEVRSRPSRIRRVRRSRHERRRGGAPARFHDQRDRMGSAHERVPRSIQRSARHRRARDSNRRPCHLCGRQPASAACRAIRGAAGVRRRRRDARDLPRDTARRPASRARVGRIRKAALCAAAVRGVRARDGARRRVEIVSRAAGARRLRARAGVAS